MRTQLFYMAIFCTASLLMNCQPEKPIDTDKLSAELDSMFFLDQKYRLMMDSVENAFGRNSEQMRGLLKIMREVDSSNVVRVVEIIDQVGDFPGPSLVGNKSGEAAFFVLQHAPDSIQAKYYDLIIEAGKNGELKKRLVALYHDRYLMHKGEPQIFGSQVRIEYFKDSITGKQKEHAYVWPIADTTNIDSLRMWNGLGNLEEYLNQFGASRWAD